MIKRSFKIVVELSAIVVAGLTVLAVFAAIRLSSGPVSLNFLTPHIERGLNAEEGNFVVALGGTVLAWSEADRDLDLVVTNVRVRNRAGVQQAFVPELAIGLSLRALVFGEFRPTRLELYGPRLQLVRTKDGTIDFGNPVIARPTADGAVPPGKAAPPLAGTPVGGDITETVLTSLLARPPRNHPLHYLRSVSLTNAVLEFEDLRNNFRLVSPASELELVRVGRGVGATARLNLTVGNKTAPVELSGAYRAASKKITLSAKFRNLELARLARIGDGLAPLSGAKFPAEGELGVVMGADGGIEAVTLEATSGAGSLAIEGVYPDPIRVRAMRIKARVEDGMRRFKLDHLTADVGGPRIGLSGEGRRENGRTSIALNLTLRDTPAPELKRLWPSVVAPSALAWIKDNLERGTISRGDAQFDLAMAAGEVDLVAMKGSFDFTDGTAHYMKPMPPVTGITGKGTLTTNGLKLEGLTGRLGDLRIDDGTVAITGFDVKGADMVKIEAVTRGTLPSALTLLNHPRLGLLKGFDIDPRRLEGDMAARLAIEFPTLASIPFDVVEVLAAANLKGVKVPKAALGADLTDGEVTLRLDKRGMDVSGTIRLGGVPAQVKWTENFYPQARYRSRYGVTGVIDGAGRRRLGLASEPHVTGPVGFDLVVTRFDDRRTGVSGVLDVKNAALVFDEIEWRKKRGVEGFARFSLDVRGDKVRRIPKVQVKAADLEATGTVRFARDGISVESFNFSRLAFGESDIAVTGRARPDGGLDLTVTGAKVDVRPFLESRRKEGAKRPLAITVEIGEARVGPGPPIYDVNGTMSRATGDWRNMTIRGTVGKARKPVLVVITPGKTTRTLNITSNDAGATLKTFAITDDMVGGRLTISGKYDDTKPGAPLNAMFRVKKFQMVRAPLMAKVLGVLSLTGMLDALSGKGIAFEELQAPFTKTGDDLRIKDAKAYGAALGFTASGWVDLEKDTLDVSGTVVPAYTLNSVFGHIPLLGPLLTGEKGSGVFAATYRMQGKLDDPQVSTNPLATLAPGFLRGLFNIFDSPSRKPPTEGGGDAPPPPTPPRIPRPSE